MNRFCTWVLAVHNCFVYNIIRYHSKGLLLQRKSDNLIKVANSEYPVFPLYIQYNKLTQCYCKLK